MREQTVRDIQAYIKFLEGCGYAVSLSFLKTAFASFAVELMQYDFHPHSVCNYLKQNPGTEGRCIHNKAVVKRMKLKKPCYASCYAGVEEFLVPVQEKGSVFCYIHLSGYRGKLETSHKKTGRLAARCTDAFFPLYGELSQTVPTMEHVLSFVRPLQYMLLALHGLYLDSRANTGVEEATRQFYVRALQYIHENYPNPINCRSVAEHLQYSQSYVRHIFQKEGSTSVQAKINEVRLNNAKRLLRSTHMSITEIAFSVGFTDSNYFSSFFKKQEHMTPREYRNTAHTTGNPVDKHLEYVRMK